MLIIYVLLKSTRRTCFVFKRFHNPSLFYLLFINVQCKQSALETKQRFVVFFIYLFIVAAAFLFYCRFINLFITTKKTSETRAPRLLFSSSRRLLSIYFFIFNVLFFFIRFPFVFCFVFLSYKYVIYVILKRRQRPLFISCRFCFIVAFLFSFKRKFRPRDTANTSDRKLSYRGFPIKLKKKIQLNIQLRFVKFST